MATATTDQEGQFSISGLQGGMYQVVVGQEMKFYRMWAPDTAPPGARQSVPLVAGGQSARTGKLSSARIALLADEPLGLDRGGRHSDCGPHCRSQSR